MDDIREVATAFDCTGKSAFYICKWLEYEGFTRCCWFYLIKFVIKFRTIASTHSGGSNKAAKM
jgi:hypothetical protein